MNGLSRSTLALVFLLASALAARFATFSVEPFGTQRVNLDTGVTTLPQGGVLTDHENGLRLKAGYLEYKEGSFVRARSAELLSEKETFLAQSLEHDIPKQEARFKGLTFSNPDFKNLRAKEALALFSEDVVILKGSVQAESPRLQAEALVADLKGREALVLGSFLYQEGKATLKGQGASARLYLRFVGGKVQASTKVPPSASPLAQYAARLP
ncbi:hypothetical protein CSW23_13825 [Thermus scotoductus]|uniref:Organic solvent tolerance-like N-terminal domain-containing protein n=1 Tax=Thermus scotoductus TaxID=37636 RepID=A0A430RQD3_THESC|nr:hypothetical protein [Thermus scotoductus]RTG99321.1 hypothetical protein CSW50_13095 [Thermus scotoductus]RTH21349.1 hypothetical protein CSW40_13280 [Thermus scotoductus]RTI03096.1 hypothetical protein CSW31_00095 [Thermus scotoductus]RTI13446.1 hypothetical protein CSW23_13825 [Thermus scotoductus]RTI34061.1 hypothetical protein CSW18_13035 [Thermus scotoductus]